MGTLKQFEHGRFYKAKKDVKLPPQSVNEDYTEIKKGVSYMATGPYTLIVTPPSKYMFTGTQIEDFFELDPYRDINSTSKSERKGVNINYGSNDPINPDHYKQYSVEVIDMMERIYGPEAVAAHCECCAFKYRMRAGMKDDIKEQYRKEKWYLDKAKELRKKARNKKSKDKDRIGVVDFYRMYGRIVTIEDDNREYLKVDKWLIIDKDNRTIEFADDHEEILIESEIKNNELK